MFLIYTRRSTDDAQNQKNTLENQEKQCMRYAKDHKLSIAKESIAGLMTNGIIYERHSGWKSSPITVSGAGLVEYQIERPKFMQMISLLVQKQYEGIIVMCWDRISRNPNDDIIIKDLIDNKHIRILFVEADYDHKSSAGKLHRNIDSTVAQYWSDKTSEAVRKSSLKMREEGKFPHKTPTGYLDLGADKKAIDPVRAPIVRRIFEQYATGEWSMTQLAKWAAKQGLTHKPQRRTRTKEQMMQGLELEQMEKVEQLIGKGAIESMLHNPFFIGKTFIKGEEREGIHPALLIDEQGRPDTILFYKVQEMLKKNRRSYYTIDKEFYSYRKMVSCTCGRSYSPYRSKRTGEVYYQLKCKEGCDNSVLNLREDHIVGAVGEIIRKIHFTDEELVEIEDGMESGLKKVTAQRNKEVEDLHRERKRILSDISYLRDNKITLLRQEVMTPAEWKAETVAITDKLAELESKQQGCSETEADMLDYVLAFSELIKEAASLYGKATDNERHKLTKLIFSELVMKDGKVFKYTAKPEFAVLLQRTEQVVMNGGRWLT